MAEWPEVEGAIGGRCGGGSEPGEGFLHRQSEIAAPLTSQALHVEGRLPLPNELSLQKQRFELAPHRNHVDALCELQQVVHVAAEGDRRAEVAPDSAPKVDGLADVQRAVASTRHDVDAGLIGNAVPGEMRSRAWPSKRAQLIERAAGAQLLEQGRRETEHGWRTTIERRHQPKMSRQALWIGSAIESGVANQAQQVDGWPVRPQQLVHELRYVSKPHDRGPADERLHCLADLIQRQPIVSLLRNPELAQELWHGPRPGDKGMKASLAALSGQLDDPMPAWIRPGSQDLEEGDFVGERRQAPNSAIEL